MFVRVGNQIVSGESQVIMIYLTDKDKQLISSMRKEDHVYCEYPDDMPEKYKGRVKLLMEMFKEACEEDESSTNPDNISV